jgi:hypothetical protein
MTRNTGIEVTAEFDPRTIDKKYSLEPMHNNDVSYERFHSQQTPAQEKAMRREWAQHGKPHESGFKATMVGLVIKAFLITCAVFVVLAGLKVFHVAL